MQDQILLSNLKKGLPQLKRFMPASQLEQLTDIIRSGGAWQLPVAYCLKTLQNISKIPLVDPNNARVPDQTESPVAHLHYYHGNTHWLVIALDHEGDRLSNIGCVIKDSRPQMGFFPLSGLVYGHHGARLDTQFVPAPLNDVIYDIIHHGDQDVSAHGARQVA